jgi:hypothetical protein
MGARTIPRSITVEELELPFPPVAPTCGVAAAGGAWERSPFGTFDECPMCGDAMAPEHAHFRCVGCGWRDSCCD